ncbi:MAG: hypothetical protein IPP77_05945 [Bacteroidetes bacterium]|nr:hypothetical protein [Bacteroidota bacterium]
MKLETAVKKVAEFLASNPGSTKEAIGKATNVKGIELTNVIKRLRKEEQLVEEFPDGEVPTFSIKTEEQTETVTNETEIPVEDEQLPAKKGRNNDKYQFNGNSYGKGKLVLEVVRQYVAGHPKTTYKQLKEIFPDTLLTRFGIAKSENEARSLSGARERYFFSELHQILLKDKTVVVVCNQFTAQNIQPFLKAAKALGFKIK